MPAAEDVNYFLNWSLYSIIGELNKADNLYAAHGKHVRNMAKHLQENLGPFEPTPIYRGIFINPKYVKKSRIKLEKHRTFMSFSEDPDVACWFGYPGSNMNNFLRMQDANRKGYISEYIAKPAEILFSWQWAEDINLLQCAAIHPEMDVDTIEWYLNTQQEVIIKPVDMLKVIPIDDYDCTDVEELNIKFSPTGLSDW